MQHKPNLLIVDDDSVTADMISQALGREGYALTVVNSGAEAVRQGKDRRFDLVLTDASNAGARWNGCAVVVSKRAAGCNRIIDDCIWIQPFRN